MLLTTVEQLREQLMRVDGVLVWINPIVDGRDRTDLNKVLADVAASGVFVSAHPDVIAKMGTKDVLFRTRTMGWGCDTRQYPTFAEMHRELPESLATGEARVLKQARGHSGDGVWKVQLADHAGIATTIRRFSARSCAGPARQAWQYRDNNVPCGVHRSMRAILLAWRWNDRPDLPAAASRGHGALLSRAGSRGRLRRAGS